MRIRAFEALQIGEMPFKGAKQRLISDISAWNEACARLLRKSLERGESLDVACRRVFPRYIPGLHLFPKADHGFWGHIDVAFWAAFMYPLSSFFYILSSPRTIFPEKDDDDTPVNSTKAIVICNLIAATLLLIDALICFVDWEIMRNAGHSAHNTSVTIAENQISLTTHGTTSKLERNYFINNTFFLAAATIYFIQGIWMENYHTDLERCNPDLWCGTFWMNFSGAVAYLGSALMCLWEGIDDLEEQKSDPSIVRTKFITLDYNELNWFIWGDILFVLSSIMFCLQPVFLVAVDPDIYTTQIDAYYYLVTNIVMFIDASCYSIGYHVYMTKLRDSLVRNIIELEKSKMNGDNYDMKLREDVHIHNPVIADANLLSHYIGTTPVSPDRFSSMEGEIRS